MESHVLPVFLNAVIAYVVIIDPIGIMLIFNGLMHGRPDRARRHVALRATVLTAVVTIGFGFCGATVLRQLGIAMDSFRIAGGLLLFHTAFGMVVKPDIEDDSASATPPEDPTVFPLTIPLLAGPGCLTLTILLFDRARDSLLHTGALLAALLLVLAATFAALVCAHRVAAILGATVNAVTKRLLGVLLAALSIQFIADGIRGLFGPISG